MKESSLLVRAGGGHNTPVIRRRRWLNRNVVAIGVSSLMADANYEMVLSVLPLFLILGLGAPVYALGLVEGVADGAAAAFKFASGFYSDRIRHRKPLGAAGYAVTAGGLGLLGAVTTWPQVLLGRTVAWIGRGARQPIRSAMLAGSVEEEDLGKAFGFHQAMDTVGAVIGPAIAFWLISTGHLYRDVFGVAIVPGVLAFVCFAVLTRDPRTSPPKRAMTWQPLPATFWRLLVAVAVFGIADFAPTFMTLRAAEMIQVQAGEHAAVLSAIGFYVGMNVIGSLVAYPAGWVCDRLGKPPVLAAGYGLFGAACLLGAIGHGTLGVVAFLLPAGAYGPLVKATEESFVGSLVEDRLRGTAYGVLHAVNGLGDLVSSVAVGLLWSHSGPRLALSYGGVLALAAAGLLLVMTLRVPKARWRGPKSPVKEP
ncbi:MAG TPA: MFS transporter [Actinomycetota bacterium]|nr:MFS transporter [Actinomycetota bacterium]